MGRAKLYFNEKLKVHDKELQNLLNNGGINVYRVTWIGDPNKNWLVTRESVGRKSFKRKNQAVKKARKMAKNDKPSVLVIERKKNSKFGQSGVSDWAKYD